MKFLLSTIEKTPQTSIEFTNPRSYARVHASEVMSAHIHFSETKYKSASDTTFCPTLAAFLAQARFNVALYTQQSDRNLVKDKSPCVWISFRDGVLGKSIEIEAFIQSEIFTSAVLLSGHGTQIDFNVEISDETILSNLETKLLARSANLDFSASEILDKFRIAFL